MQELTELIQSINVSRFKASGLWPFVLEPGSLMERLFEAIYSGQISSDAEAITLLYPGERGGSKFLNLRERLRERILSVVFLLEFKAASGTDRQRAYVDCNRKWSTALVLQAKNARFTSVSLMEDLLKQTIHFEFTELSMGIASALRLHYGTVQGDTSKYELYRQLYQNTQATWVLENEAEDLYTHLVSHFVSTKATKAEFSGKAEGYFERISPQMEQSQSFKLHLCGRLIEVMIFSGRNDYASTARVCEEAIAFFRAKPFESNIPLQAFYYQLIVCYLQLKEFEKGQAIMRQYQSIYEDGSFNWFKFQELYFLLAMHTKQYSEAYRHCVSVLAKLRPGLPPQIVEMWKIYEAYAYLLVHIGVVEMPPGEAVSKFKVSKFLNETPVFSKDKQGMNIPILVVQILFNLADRNYAQSIDRMEAVDKYCGRYLKQNDTFRSHCFIKALLQIPAASFHRGAAERKSEKFIEQLRAQPLEVAYQTHEVEIIPYEILWDLAMATLSQQIQKMPVARRVMAG